MPAFAEAKINQTETLSGWARMKQETVIRCTDLTRCFGDLVAVDQLSIEIQQGEIMGFLGHNGAGKTTTVRLLNGVLTATAGVVEVFGMSAATQGSQIRARTGVLTETPSLEERLTGRENLTLYADLYAVPKDRVASRVDEVLDTMGLLDRADEKVAGYSKGMKQRLAIGRALLHDPEILFLDEPTAGLDPVSTRQVHEMVIALSHARNRTVFLCTHNLAEAQKLCDRVAVMRHGQLIALGSPAQLAAQLGRGQRIELEVEEADQPALIERLSHDPRVSKVEQRNGLIEITGLLRDQVPDLVRSLVDSDVSLYRIHPQAATLEDAYFVLQGEKEGEG